MTSLSLPDELAAELHRSRQRSLDLTALPDADLIRQVDPLMSPLVWDLAHIGNYEALWLLRAIDGRPSEDPGLDNLYDAFEHPRAERPSLPILGPRDARAYVTRIREEVLDLLARTELSGPRLLDQGFVYRMVIQHEHQHCETMLATRQLMLEDAPPLPGGPAPAASRPAEPTMVTVAGGEHLLGASADPWALDNELPRHAVRLDAFAIDAYPVTNRQFIEFMADGGYDRPELWTEHGWKWRNDAQLTAPQFWRAAGESYEVLRFGAWRPVRPAEPVQHVCWYEADAFARWAGKRLPTEQEWEVAASGSPDGQAHRRFPWGDGPATPDLANYGQRHEGPAEAGAYPGGVSAWGCHQMLGDVWEWTSTNFDPHPGFEAFPYAEYSEVFFTDRVPGGDDPSGYKVLRGGSWAADITASRTTFRNWDHPIRRQIFSGFRCARSVD